jgi:hypothetical protein
MRTQLESAGIMGRLGGGSSAECKYRGERISQHGTKRAAAAAIKTPGPKIGAGVGGWGLGLSFSELQPGKRGVPGADL